MSGLRKFREKCGGLFLHNWFELIMPIIFLRIAAKGETMYSPKALSNASFVCPVHFESAPIPSKVVMAILYTEDEDEMSALAGIRFVSTNFSNFVTCSSCIIFHFFPSYFVFCYPYPCVVVLQIVSLGFFCFFRLEELIDVVFPSLSRSSHCSACFASNAEAWIPFCCFFFDHLVSLGEKRSS